MLSLTLGPLSLPMAPVLLALAVWLASATASGWARHRSGRREAAPAFPTTASASASTTATATAGAGSDRADAAAAAQRAEQARQAGQSLVNAAFVGLLAARLVQLGLNAQPYLASPWSVIDLRDGGWHEPSGFAAGLAWLAWCAKRSAPLRAPLAVGLLAGATVWIALTLATRPPPSQVMPALALQPLEGGAPLALAQAAAGRPVVVNLWASWCGPCRQEMPVLAAAQQREAAIGILFVNQGEAPAAVRRYLAGQGLALREVLLDAGSRLGPAVGSRGLPTTLFYDAEGRLVDAHVGVLNAAALESRLRALRDAGPGNTGNTGNTVDRATR